MSRADIGGFNIFQDRDQDGLSDKEEISYGTDPENNDTDGDGYSDKVEIESGYDPLKPAPGDKIVLESETQVLGVSDEDSNLTDKFLEEIEKYETGEAAALDEILKNGSISDEDLEKIKSSSEGDLGNVLSDVFEEDFSIGSDGLEDDSFTINEDDIIIIPKPEGETEEDIKQKEKEQIEKYMSSLLYIMAVNKPFDLEDIDDLPDEISKFFLEVEDSFQEDQIDKIREYKKITKEVFDQIKKLEVPSVLVENHLDLLATYQSIYNNIDEEEMFNDDDPLAFLVHIEMFQKVIFEFEQVEQNFNKILEEYEIDSFNLNTLY